MGKVASNRAVARKKLGAELRTIQGDLAPTLGVLGSKSATFAQKSGIQGRDHIRVLLQNPREIAPTSK